VRRQRPPLRRRGTWRHHCVAGDLRLRDERLLAEVFDFIERHYHERISLRDVASAVNISSGHLTTVVHRKTGRPVQE
jgi:AraC family transcriptional regulator, transcriptional activator of pobA